MAKSKSNELTYEAALAELQKILDNLQDGKTGLDSLTQQLARAKELTDYCKGRLRDVEKDVELFKKSME